MPQFGRRIEIRPSVKLTDRHDEAEADGGRHFAAAPLMNGRDLILLSYRTLVCLRDGFVANEDKAVQDIARTFDVKEATIYRLPMRQ